MAKALTIEGTRDEVQLQLQSFPKEQHFRLTPIPRPDSVNGTKADEPSLADQFAGRVGRFHFGGANLSQDSGKKFAELMADKKHKGRL